MWFSGTLQRIAPHLPAALALLLWAAAAGSLALWWLHRPAPALAPAPIAGFSSTTAVAPAPGAVERALGHTAAAVAAPPSGPSRFELQGVIANSAGRGSALLRIDGQPALAFVAGQMVVSGWRLDAVHPQGVRLSPEGPGQPLELTLPERR